MLSRFFSKKEPTNTMIWEDLRDISQLHEIDKQSMERNALIFKHSKTCPISSMALRKFESHYSKEASFSPYLLDILTYRSVSNEIAKKYGVTHESPQAILISRGKAIFDSSHNGIMFSELEAVSKKSATE